MLHQLPFSQRIKIRPFASKKYMVKREQMEQTKGADGKADELSNERSKLGNI